MKFMHRISSKRRPLALPWRFPLYPKARAWKSKPSLLPMLPVHPVKSRPTPLAKIDIFMPDDLFARFLLLGSARASRAGEGAPAFANFIPVFRRGRRNAHARARALP